jgi:hypothetical protein
MGWVWAHCWVLRDQARPAPCRGWVGLVCSGRASGRVHRLGVGGGGCRLLFENYTVDASIFVAVFA